MKNQQSEKDVPQRFKENLQYLCQYVASDIFKSLRENKVLSFSPDLLNFGFEIVSKKQDSEIIGGFISATYRGWERVLNKDEDFFKFGEGFEFFKDLPKDKVDEIKGLFDNKYPDGRPYITADNKMVLWRCFKNLVILSIKYVHEARGPVVRQGKKVYERKDTFPCIDLADMVRKFGVNKLEWEP